MSCLHQLLIDRSADSTSCCSHWLVTLADDLTLGTSRHSSMVVSGIAGPHAAAVDFAAAWSRARWIDTASCIGCVQETGLQTTCVISSGSAPSFCGSCVVFLAVPVLGPSPAGSDQNELPSSSRPCSVQPASLRYLRASSAGNGRPSPGRVIGGTSTCIWFGLSFAMSSLLIFWVVGATLLPPLAVGHVRAVELVQPVPDPAHVRRQPHQRHQYQQEVRGAHRQQQQLHLIAPSWAPTAGPSLCRIRTRPTWCRW